VIFLHWGFDMTNKQQLIRRIRHGASGTRLCLGIVVTIGAAACAPLPDPTHQTVDYYRANREAREAKLAECENDPGALAQTPDCINAKAAARRDVKTLRDLPPLDLPGATADKAQRESGERTPSASQGNNR
jgi:hypothetical protein